MPDDRIPLTETRLAAIWETAKLWSKDHCRNALMCKPGCLCVPRHTLAGPAMELVEEVRMLRKLYDHPVPEDDW